MPELKIQEAKKLFKKIHSQPKSYNLKIVDGVITGSDEKVSFKLFKNTESGVFEVSIDGLVFTNNTGEWNNAVIMLENTIKKLRAKKNFKRLKTPSTN